MRSNSSNMEEKSATDVDDECDEHISEKAAMSDQSPKHDSEYDPLLPNNRALNRNRQDTRQDRLRLLLFLFVFISLLAVVSWRLSFPNFRLFDRWKSGGHHSKRPNIVFILTDDQDARLGSLNYMNVLQDRVIGEGINVVNHFGTVSLCCPARATLFRGQAAHNTNFTHVGGPGGGYLKWLRTGEYKDYLPHWLRKAGYTTAYFGKFLNGYGMDNYDIPPAGWDFVDALVAPYIYSFKNVVMSRNGERPIHYKGWHQTDVIRVKALDRLEWMTSQKKPFFLEIAPASPHVTLPGARPTIPLARHAHMFPGLVAPRSPNWNPADEYTAQKPGWLREMPLMNETIIARSDQSMRARIQGLQGIDELVHDVVELLESKGLLENTYIIYTTDNGFHLGSHRVPGGKMLPYIEDVNLPFAVRGPGIPKGIISTIPSTHMDVAPTLLDIAGVPQEDWPPFFDGRSLLQEWKTLSPSNDEISREILNVEYWGSAAAPASEYTRQIPQNSYKSLRIISGSEGYLFNRWCFDNQTELYDTVRDPYELTNLAINPDKETQRLIDRLSGLLLVTKSCGGDTCRKPWSVLRSGHGGKTATFNSLSEAMDPQYDDFFASLPHFGFHRCMQFQSVENEGPYYPPESVELGGQWRELSTDDSFWEYNSTRIVESAADTGSEVQRFMGLRDLVKDARPLTDEEIGWPVRKCQAPDFCGVEYEED